MNGKEIERIEETFRYELGQAMKPVTDTLGKLNDISVEHGEDIVENKTDIGHLKAGIGKLSGRVWAVILGVPTLLLVVVGVLSYLTRTS